MKISRNEALLRALASEDPMPIRLIKGETIHYDNGYKLKKGVVYHAFKYLATPHVIIAYEDPDAVVVTPYNGIAYLYKIDGYVQQ